MINFVAYYRVSTKGQGRSGLGLEAQRDAIATFITQGNYKLIAEFVEVQSGKRDERKELWKALEFAKRNCAKLIIHKLDRFSRRVSFVAGIIEQRVDLVIANMPNATVFQLHISAAVAEEELRAGSERTKAALAQAKKKGKKLGKNGALLAIANKAHADEFADRLMPIINEIGFWNSYSEIARKLNARGERTRSGKLFGAQTVKNIIQRFNE